jgi:hypothetical protein
MLEKRGSVAGYTFIFLTGLFTPEQTVTKAVLSYRWSRKISVRGKLSSENVSKKELPGFSS